MIVFAAVVVEYGVYIIGIVVKFGSVHRYIMYLDRRICDSDEVFLREVISAVLYSVHLFGLYPIYCFYEDPYPDIVR